MKVKKLSKQLEQQFRCHKVKIRIKPFGTVEGDVPQYIFRVKLSPGTKINKLLSCISDIRLCLQFEILETFWDKGRLYLIAASSVNPNNSLKEVLQSTVFQCCNMELPIAHGYDVMHEYFLADLAEMPHILYGGPSGTGKTIALMVLILSIIYKRPAQMVNILIVSIDSNDYDEFSGIQHLSHPIIKDEPTAVYAIRKLTEEMKRRKQLTADELSMLPAIVLIIDEAVSLFQGVSSTKLSSSLSTDFALLLRQGRHAKIHIVVGTQDPTKANTNEALGNITTRVAFHCNDHNESKVILKCSGAEKITGKGAMLYKSSDTGLPIRIQGSFFTPDELKELVSLVIGSEHDLRNKFVIPEMDFDEESETPSDYVQRLTRSVEVDDTPDKDLAKIIMWTLARDKASSNMIQNDHEILGRKISRNEADDYIDIMFEMGIVSEKNHTQPRKVLPKYVEDISKETLAFLAKYGYTEDLISEVMSKRTASP